MRRFEPGHQYGGKKGVPVKRYTQAETIEQEQFIYAGLIQGVESRTIKREFRKQFQVGTARWNTLITRVQRRMQDEDKERAGNRKSEALRRFHQRIASLDARAREAMNAKDPQLAARLFGEARQQEAMLADITGIRAPLKIEVEAQVHQTVSLLMMQMTPEQLTAQVRRYKETLALAQQAKAMLLEPPKSGPLPVTPKANVGVVRDQR